MIKTVEHESRDGLTDSIIRFTCNQKSFELKLLNISEFNTKENLLKTGSLFEFSMVENSNLYRLNINDAQSRQVECICEQIKLSEF